MAQAGASPFEDDVQVSGEIGDEQTSWNNIICKSSRPSVAFFTVAFRFAALILYLLNGFVGMDYVTLFVVTVLLLACDFWTIKNVSGRLLVGLRWGTRVTETGQTEWYFLTHPERAGNAKPVDSRIFWLSLFLAPLLWLLLGVAALLSFSLDWLVLCSFALALTGTNTYGYYKCSAAARQRLQQALADSAIKAAVGGGGGSAFGTALISSMFGSSGAQPASGGAAAAAAPAATAARGSPAPGQAVTSKPGKAFEGDATGLGDDDAGGFVHSSEGGDGVPSRNPFDDDVAV
ncbi:hypothetical protein FNF31_06075 [Cafeteria roenbergensis]|uniref:Golgi apparatus membrane protein TVP23 homolog n=1 Tax=Cafeteria roenbergensis TaxID=33653 RepID=A0A5A8CR64_CAFRO|nr:hypothetical protein FNF28_06865 [Cafeteria roenbergensis]KAA0155536.1 hypothetical protein FNF31_06075 [Cafeteria roenbergensis]